jgi:serine/threonine protein kinase
LRRSSSGDSCEIAIRGFEFSPDYGWGSWRGSEDSLYEYDLYLAYSPPQISHGIDETYSLGVLAYEMLTGFLPFACNIPEVISLLRANASPPSVSALSEAPRWLSQLIDACMAKKQKHRPTLCQVVESLRRQQPPPPPNKQGEQQWLDGRLYKRFATEWLKHYSKVMSDRVKDYKKRNGDSDTDRISRVSQFGAAIRFRQKYLR